MASRRRRYKQSKIWPWLSFLIFGLVAALLGYSAFTKKSPAAVLKSVLKSKFDEGDIRGLSKQDLISLAQSQTITIERLETDLDRCQTGDGFKKGIISTSSSTLNMRSKPSLESEIIIRIPTGSRVSILYYDNQELFLDGAMGQWCKIKYSDQEGWAWGNYIKEEDPI